MTRSQMLRIGLLAAIVLAGCAPSTPIAGGAVPAPTHDAMVQPTAEAMGEPTDGARAKPTESAMAKPTQDAMAKPAGTPSGDAMMSKSPAWFDTALTDVNSGKPF